MQLSFLWYSTKVYTRTFLEQIESLHHLNSSNRYHLKNCNIFEAEQSHAIIKDHKSLWLYPVFGKKPKTRNPTVSLILFFHLVWLTACNVGQMWHKFNQLHATFDICYIDFIKLSDVFWWRPLDILLILHAFFKKQNCTTWQFSPSWKYRVYTGYTFEMACNFLTKFLRIDQRLKSVSAISYSLQLSW